MDQKQISKQIEKAALNMIDNQKKESDRIRKEERERKNEIEKKAKIVREDIRRRQDIFNRLR